jgi:hypothetical protein
MSAHRFDRLGWRRKAGLIALAAALLALGGCVYYPDGYGGGYYAPAPAYSGSGYYAPAPTYYGPRYYQRPYYPY